MALKEFIIDCKHIEHQTITYQEKYVNKIVKRFVQ